MFRRRPTFVMFHLIYGLQSLAEQIEAILPS